MQKQATFTVRLDPEKLVIFNAICTLNQVSGSDVLRQAIDKYIAENKEKAISNMARC